MAIEVILDIIDGTEHEEATDSARYVRPCIVRGLDADPLTLTFRARSAPGIPQQGQAHPTIPGATVKRHRVKPITDTACRVEVIYEADQKTATNGENQWRFTRRSYETDEPTQIDANGKPIQVKYTASPTPTATVGGNSSVSQAITKTATVPAGRTVQTLIATGATVTPLPDELFDAVGSTNKSSWKGGSAGLWKFGAIEETTNDFGKTYSYELSFEKRKTTWDEFAIFRDENDQIPPDIDSTDGLKHPKNSAQASGNGVTRARTRDESEFNAVFAFLQESSRGVL